ncbi:MAG: hypothetical protein L6R38_004783 [Xanthoria sp. 2 TBL-2021]|nr:MAG: hypothetical protein L6R38_004783 [Xanthoria sp. 2 TBL-2021]
MPSPAKRRRLFETSDPDAELHERRARNDKKLKSRFESIFEKYSKDFSGIGDVIDFEEDKIAVDNGHLWDMKDEKDPGHKHPSQLEDDNPSSQKTSETPRPERVIPDSQEYESDDNDPLGILEDALATNIHRVGGSVGSSLLGCRNDYLSRDSASVHTGALSPLHDRWVEPAWRVPLLPADVNVQKALPSPSPSFEDESNSSRSASPEGVSIWALPKRKRKRQANASGNLLSRTTHSVSSKPSLPARWTLEERQVLRQLKFAGLPWVEIEKRLPNRTSGAIQMFWSSLQKKPSESPLQSGSVPSDGLLLQSLGDIGNGNDVLTNRSNRPLQAEELDTPAAANLARHDAELEEDLASLLVSESKPDGSSTHPPKETVFCSDTVIPDSQDSLGTPQVLEQSPDPQTDTLTYHPGLESGRNDPFLSEKSSTGTVAGPLLPALSSHTSPNATNQDPKVYTCDHRLQYLQTLCDNLQPAPEAYPPSSALTDRHFIQNDDLRRSKEWNINASSENSSNKADRSMEHLVKDVDGISCSGNESSGPLDDSVGRLTTHIRTIKSRELSDSRADVANAMLVQATIGESGNEQIMHGTKGRPVLSEVSLVPSEVPDLVPNLLADASKPRTEAASTPQNFVRIEIPLLSDTVPEKQVLSDSVPKECFNGRVIDQHVRYAGYVTPPSALLPAQEESLRKIKPFSLILPIEGSPTRHERLQWKSSYLQSLDQKYRLGQGETPSDDFSPRIGIPQGKGSDQLAHSTSSTAAVGTENLEVSGSDSFADYSPETDTPRKRAILRRPMSNVEDDEDDLQLLHQPAIALNFQSKKRQSHSACKQQLAFRPKIGSDDISDDELSTPSKTARDRVEMTPVQASTARAPKMSPAY